MPFSILLTIVIPNSKLASMSDGTSSLEVSGAKRETNTNFLGLIVIVGFILFALRAGMIAGKLTFMLSLLGKRVGTRGGVRGLHAVTLLKNIFIVQLEEQDGIRAIRLRRFSI